MHRFRLVTLASCVAMAIVSCAPQTTMLNSWTDPNYQAGSIKKIVVLGVAQNAGARRTYEDEFVAALKKMNLDAAVSYTIVPELSPGDSIRIQSTFQDHGFTHVLCTRVIDRKLKLAVANGEMKADGETIYTANDMKVGLFQE